ncbi:hypothetical protein E1264_27385 [Actinomadura sp. KC216]|uniref:Tc toxin subunit A-related protein n=1 Tax=Actinomadura sp. KC216 TaxID=2530370 RepID=UPI0010460FF5|nr:hypothetical protein [Actinomadura sp. KC216]TDB83697.1 hypothetical protein E1264_27385 [Actinomadura sp. KC216]
MAAIAGQTTEFFPNVAITPITTTDGVYRNAQITVAGTAGCKKQTTTTGTDGTPQTGPLTSSPQSIQSVDVKLGNGPFVRATANGPSTTPWTQWSLGPVDVTGVVGNTLTITARVTAPGPDPQRTDDTTTSQATLTLTVDRTPPVVNLTTPVQMTRTVDTTATPPTAFFEIKGTAVDDFSTVTAVTFTVDNGPARQAVLGGSGKNRTWTTGASTSTSAVKAALGDHTVKVTATDQQGNVSAATAVTLHAVQGFKPHDELDVFGPADYLEDLQVFAAKRVVAAPASSPKMLDAQLLGAVFFQRYAQLIDHSNMDVAVAPVRQVRVAVEVLRRYLTAAAAVLPASAETTYRTEAYGALLAGLGVSADELRRARGDRPAQEALAERLGVVLPPADQPAAPNPLDMLLFTDADIAAAGFEEKLEETVGLVDTTQDILINRPPATSRLLVAQLDGLRARWKQQDDSARVFGDVPVPVIDPDLLMEADLKDGPAKSRRTERLTEVAALAKEIDDLRKTKSTPLAGFDAVVAAFLPGGSTALAELTAGFEQGLDLTGALDRARLTPAALTQLIRSRQLATAATLTEADWTAAIAILTQVRKIGRYPAWREQEQRPDIGISLDPALFPAVTDAPVDLPPWRADPAARRAWLSTLRSRAAERQTVVDALATVVNDAEGDALPGLRDALAAAAQAITPDTLKTRNLPKATGLLIDLAAAPSVRTSRVQQAIETLQGALFGVRTSGFARFTVQTSTGSFAHPAAAWQLVANLATPTGTTVAYGKPGFDTEWAWWGAHETYRAAGQALAYPERLLRPTLRPTGLPPIPNPTPHFTALVALLRGRTRITPAQARQEAAAYLRHLRDDSTIPLPADLENTTFKITDQLTDQQLADRQTLSRKLLSPTPTSPVDTGDPHTAAGHLQEPLFFVPVLMAEHLQRSGEHLAALDWLKTVYAFHLPLPAPTTLSPRKTYHGLTLDMSLTSSYPRPADLPVPGLPGLSPFEIARSRRGALSRFVVTLIARCLVEFANAEFTRDSDDSRARARGLYETAAELLDPAVTWDAWTTDKENIFGKKDPIVIALDDRIKGDLAKLRQGLNIAGLERLRADASAIAPRQPTPYRYSVLVARAKELTQYAAGAEAAMLSALEKFDAEEYTRLNAVQNLELGDQNVALRELGVTEAAHGLDLAGLQADRVDLQITHLEDLLNPRDTAFEVIAAIGGAGLAVAAGLARKQNPLLAGASGVGSLIGGISSIVEKRKDRRFQLDLAKQDQRIAGAQQAIARDRVGIAETELAIARTQLSHAAETVDFLHNKFTGAELYEFMSQVLTDVYRSLLQQATAIARLAQDQLAFERQEPPAMIIHGDYWEFTGEPDRRGLTGAARLLADLVDLDQRAFLGDRRRLQLSRNLSLAQLDPVAFERFRETGVLVFGTPERLFDEEFPGHYLRLVKRVRVATIALVPPTRGIRATLSSSGVSRTVIGDETGFRTVTVRRDPDTIAYTATTDAGGLFELAPDQDAGMLLPFEGSGVDTLWRLELPKAANPFDYSTISDVIVTIDYEALHSPAYRRQVIDRLPISVSLDRAFSLRNEFPDLWYALHNPDEQPEPLTVRWQTGPGDFAPNLTAPRVTDLLLYISLAGGVREEFTGLELRFTPSSGANALGGAASTSVDGVLSSRRTNATAWRAIRGQALTGTWELKLKALADRFAVAEVDDLLFVLTYTATRPSWPT